MYTLFPPACVTLTRWPIYTNMTCIFWMCTCLPEMNFLDQGFHKLEHNKQTDTHTDASEGITTPHSLVVNDYLLDSWPRFIHCFSLPTSLAGFWQIYSCLALYILWNYGMVWWSARSRVAVSSSTTSHTVRRWVFLLERAEESRRQCDGNG